MALVLVNQHIPGGLELLAVAAPGREELDEDLRSRRVAATAWELRARRAARGSDEAALDAEHRSSSAEEDILCTRINIARCYTKLRRLEESVAIQREVYAREKKLLGPSDVGTLTTALNLTDSLNQVKQYVESKALARELISQCRRALGPENDITLGIQENYAEALYMDPTASRADILQAVTMLEEFSRANRRILGANHPDTVETLASLERARMRREDVP